MKTFLIIIIANFISIPVFCQNNILDASTINTALKEHAHSVKREEKIVFAVKDIDEAKLTVHQVYTVLDAGGEDVLFFNEYSTGFQKLIDAEINVYDAKGKFVNKYKMREMHAQAIGEGLVEDVKVYYFRVAAPSYPVTVQYDYEIKYKGTLHYPDFDIASPGQSIEHSAYTASVPAGIDLRFKEKNITLPPVITTAGVNKFYNWEVKNFHAVMKEEGAANRGSNYPKIMMAPNKFSMDGNEGELTNWKTLGAWGYNLCKNTINLNDETKNYMNRMVASASGDKEKIKIIYKYLQKNFRYVSIQLGIGGFRPFEAAFVDKKKYGDCKALSNYTQACLDAVGIKSYQAWINADYDSEPVDPTFPQDAFNHVILCVPLGSDTTWLECTSNTNDFGSLGSFTENRYALLLTPEGGVLVPTPKSKPSGNTFVTSTKVTLNEDASGESVSRLKTSGEYRQQMIYVLNEKKDEQIKYLVSYLGFLQPDDYELTSDKKADSAEISFSLAIDKIPDFTAGSKMFLNPRIYKIWNLKLPEDDKRTMPFYFRCPFIKTDTTVYQLPETYIIENLPRARDHKFEYGSFNTNYTYDEKANTVTSVAMLSLYQNMIPADKFTPMRKFFSSVLEEYSEKIVIRKK